MDESMTYTGADLQSMVPERWLDDAPENQAYRNSLTQAEWDALKEEAFPSDETYGY